MRFAPFAALLLAAGSGCIAHEQRQYFEVVDPAAGNINYYRMTISGGALGTDYRVQAGYFSAASVDVLRGQTPEIPEADLPLESDAAFETLMAQYYEALVDMGGRAAPGDADNPETAVLRRARLVWFGRLSPADVAAMGMSQSANPFEFRKLVFWTSARNIDLRAYGSEIDAMLDSATALIRAQKGESHAKAARNRNLRAYLLDLIASHPALAPQVDAIKALVGDRNEP